MDSNRPKPGSPSKSPTWEKDDTPKRPIPVLGHHHKEEEFVGKKFESSAEEQVHSPIQSESKLSVKATAAIKGVGSGNVHPRRSFTERHYFGWYAAVGVGFDLELWWRRSTAQVRGTALITSLLLVIVILNFGVGLAFLIKGLTETTANPYICKSPECTKAGVWLQKPMTKIESEGHVEACDNFYEFMCQNYQETQEEGNIFAGFITKPNFKVQLGIDSILGKILKYYQNDTRTDQHVKFYQSCLNFLERDRSDESVFREIAERWFGTVNGFATETNKEMEEIAAELFRAVGHASFINMAFYTYPYILIVEPHPSVMSYRFEHDGRNEEFLKIIFRRLMPMLGFGSGLSSSEDIIEEMVKGVDAMSTTIHKIFTEVKTITEIIPKAETKSSIIDKLIQDKFQDFCPPIGGKQRIQMSFSKVLDLFIGDEYKVEYITPTAHKFALAMQACFDSKNPGKHFEHPKTAFVALWIVDVFLQNLLTSMDYKHIAGEWGFNSSTWENHTFATELNTLTDYNDEYLCLESLWNALGYLPSIRFLEADKTDSVHFIDTSEDWARGLFNTARELFLSIHPEDIHWKEAFLAKAVLERGLHADVGLPLVGGVIDSYKEDLELSDEFLNNTLIGYRFTVAKAKQNWLGSTDPHPSIKWFGSGGPGNIRESLFSPNFARVDSARLVEKRYAAKEGNWEKFLGRVPRNYILYPLTIFDDQKINTLSFKHALITLPLMRSILSLLSEAYSAEKYPSLSWDELLGEKPDDIKEAPNINCSYLAADEHSTNESRHEYRMVPSDKISFTWKDDALFLSVMTAKLAFQSFKNERHRLWDGHHGYQLNDMTRKLVLQRKLGGNLTMFDEEKLFFMLYIRHSCRESWKKDQPNEKNTQLHYSLEATVLTVLMQMTEFSHTWNCPDDSMMNNKGLPRCFDWEPEGLNHTEETHGHSHKH